MGLRADGVSGYSFGGEGAASSKATDAHLFLHRLFKGLIDRLRGWGKGDAWVVGGVVGAGNS